MRSQASTSRLFELKVATPKQRQYKKTPNEVVVHIKNYTEYEIT